MNLYQWALSTPNASWNAVLENGNWTIVSQAASFTQVDSQSTPNISTGNFWSGGTDYGANWVTITDAYYTTNVVTTYTTNRFDLTQSADGAVDFFNLQWDGSRWLLLNVHKGLKPVQ